MKQVFKNAFMAGLVLVFLLPAKINAQEWTKSQKEVWQVVEDSWAQWKQKDLTALSQSLHDQYQGWNSDQPLPTNKQELMSATEAMKDMMTLNYYSIRPARIVVTANAAVVDYYYAMSFTRKMGDKEKMGNEHGKYVEFYVKDGGKWKLLGDFTAPDAEKHEGGHDDD